MKALTPYLILDGTTREAMTFYQKCLGGELFLMTYADMPAPPEGGQCKIPPEAKDRVMHAGLCFGAAGFLMASDSMPGQPYTAGDGFSINIPCDSNEEAERLFHALSEGGKITMPIGETFWAHRYGMFTDRFGVHWMVNHGKEHMG
jgi:PhnB protein